MKKQIFTNTILYTHNTLLPITKQDLSASNQFGTFLNNTYKYNIIWVPSDASSDGNTRQIRIMPQYKFGHGDDSSSSFIDALSNPVSHNVSAQPSFTTSILNSMTNKTTFTDNIVLKLHSTVTNNALTINSSLSNYSTFLANIPHNISYNMAFRLVISIYNVTTNTTEHTIYSYITNVRFGRSPIQKPGTPPDLIWDRKPDLTRYPLISTEPDSVILFEGQNMMIGECDCTAGGSLFQLLLINVRFDTPAGSKTFNLAQPDTIIQESGGVVDTWTYFRSSLDGSFNFSYEKRINGDLAISSNATIFGNSSCKWLFSSYITYTPLVAPEWITASKTGEFMCVTVCDPIHPAPSTVKVINGYPINIMIDPNGDQSTAANVPMLYVSGPYNLPPCN